MYANKIIRKCNGMLTEYQKYYILWTKGHFNHYKEPERIIIGEALMLGKDLITDGHITNYAINIFDKLMTQEAIEGVGTDKYAWMLNEMREIGHRHKAPTLLEWVNTKIGCCEAGSLSLRIDLEGIRNKMERLDGKTKSLLEQQRG